MSSSIRAPDYANAQDQKTPQSRIRQKTFQLFLFRVFRHGSRLLRHAEAAWFGTPRELKGDGRALHALPDATPRHFAKTYKTEPAQARAWPWARIRVNAIRKRI
jgi:hypothetical protein